MVADRLQRRMAAILAADVVGYSRLMGEDEEATFSALKAHRALTDELILVDLSRFSGEASGQMSARLSNWTGLTKSSAEWRLTGL